MNKLIKTAAIVSAVNGQLLEGAPACNQTNPTGTPILYGWDTTSNYNQFGYCYQYNNKPLENSTDCYTAQVYCDGGAGNEATYKYCIGDDFFKNCEKNTKSDEKKLSAGEIAGIAVGATVLAGAVIGGGVVAVKKCKRNRGSINQISKRNSDNSAIQIGIR
jgi:hypothetical protein